MMKHNNTAKKCKVIKYEKKPLHLIGSFENPLTQKDIEKAFQDLNIPKSNLRNAKLIYGNLLDGITIYEFEEEEKQDGNE